MGDEKDKQILAEAIRATMEHVTTKPGMLLLVSDGWKKDPADPAVRIGEVLCVNGVYPGGQFMAICEYTRDADDKPVYGETIFQAGDGVSSRFFEGVSLA